MLKRQLPRAMAVGLACAMLAGCSKAPSSPPALDPAAVADTLYVGGDIVTVNDAQPTAEALAVKDGKILAVGARAELEKAHQGPATKVVDLAGKALLPGFLDAHSHYFSALTVANQVNVYAPPAGPGKDVDSIVAALVQFRDANKVPAGTVIQAYGYDENVMPGGRHLNRDDLDKALPDNPVVVGHVSMHGGLLNSAAMKQYGVSAATKTPPGGVIVRKPGTNEPYGLIMETAWVPVVRLLPQPTTPQEEIDGSRAAQRLYASYGVTTAHEGATQASQLDVMKRAAAGGAALIDVIAYPFITELEPILQKYPAATWGTYENGLKIGGVKITIDGSPQGRTAAFTTPYLQGGPGGEKKWKGELAALPPAIEKAVKGVYDLGVPLNLHANGDAAIDTFLKVHEKVAAGDLGKDRRVTLIHAQFTRKDHLDKYVAYKITPSFYTLHTYYFYEAHLANRGAAQAAYISPMRDAIDKGIRPTNHSDFVVAPLDQLFMMWSAVNRISRAGAEVGPEQRITPLEALKAQTINVAWQYGEQDSKGTLEPGKRADLVILDRNPLKVEPMAIKDVVVVETLKDGKTVYAR
jgi:predicted amidohydrolase YtcJ